MTAEPVLELTEREEECYAVRFAPNRKVIGFFYKEVDGYYVWVLPEDDRNLALGCWPAGILRAIADKLDELNAPWDEQVRRDLGGAQ